MRGRTSGTVGSAVAVTAVAVVVSLSWNLGLSARQGGPVTDPKAAEALQKGEAALKVRAWEDALQAFKQANALQNKQSALALFGVARAYHGLGAFKSEADACLDALKYCANDTRMSTQLHNQRGLALVQLAQKPTDKALKEAETEFRAALDLTPNLTIGWFNLGTTLLRQLRDEEGLAALTKFVESGAKLPEIDLAKKMIENPRRAREPYAPEFSGTTLEGEFVELKEQQGKVVLLDFWGTWCPPCVAATPALKEISREFANEKNFAMIGISSDSAGDAGKLRDFVETQKMTWMEIHDISRKILAMYEIRSYPTYIVVDADGIIRERLTGWSPTSTKGEIQRAIRSALKNIPK
jgi:thiol-disulfide isomerase/thioredoxin